jgi:hypothetical protein
MSASTNFEAYKKKLDGICGENDLVFRFYRNEFPMKLVIRPCSGMGQQMSLLEGDSSQGTDPNAKMVFTFDGANVSWTTFGTFAISKTLHSKIVNQFQKMVNAWAQFCFEDAMTKQIFTADNMPTIEDEDEGDDIDEVSRELMQNGLELDDGEDEEEDEE